jgi:hypothetical protein
MDYKPAVAVARKQKASGLWDANLLAPGASKAYGWKEPGTIYQYRRLLEFGWPADHRVFRLADRFLFQLLSRLEPDDPDPTLATRARELLVEFEKPAKNDPGLGRWARQLGRQAAAAALSRAGHSQDPRLRGFALKIATDVSLHLRSEVAQKPFRRAKGKTVLDPTAFPPTIFAIEMLAFLPALQRERAGFIERLGAYLAIPAPKRAWVVVAGHKLFKPLFPILGDPLGADARGRVTDIPFALYWIELLARLGLVRQVPGAARTLASHAQTLKPAGGALLPARGRRAEPRPAPNGRHVPPGADLQAHRSPHRGGVAGCSASLGLRLASWSSSDYYHHDVR